MISNVLKGRLGNALFQISAAYCHAKKYGFEYVCPPTSLNESLWPSPRFQKLRYAKIMGNWFHEPHFNYCPIPNEDNLILDGYFQSAKYHHEFKNDLKSIFGFDDFHYTNTCAVHVRRGDYINFKEQFNLLPVEWYQNAMSEMQDIDASVEFHFYSDDIEWCKEQFPGHVYHSGLPIQDLREAAQHQHCIMSASSFSWWIAYMVPGEVIAPETWFGPKNSHHITNDLYLDTWIKL